MAETIEWSYVQFKRNEYGVEVNDFEENVKLFDRLVSDLINYLQWVRKCLKQQYGFCVGEQTGILADMITPIETNAFTFSHFMHAGARSYNEDGARILPNYQCSIQLLTAPDTAERVEYLKKTRIRMDNILDIMKILYNIGTEISEHFSHDAHTDVVVWGDGMFTQLDYTDKINTFHHTQQGLDQIINFTVKRVLLLGRIINTNIKNMRQSYMNIDARLMRLHWEDSPFDDPLG